MVDTVGADALTDEVTRMPYYPMQVKVTPEGMKILGKLQIPSWHAGHRGGEDGERTMLNHLFAADRPRRQGVQRGMIVRLRKLTLLTALALRPEPPAAGLGAGVHGSLPRRIAE